MGLFSSIGKFFKKVWKGVKKLFKNIMKPVAKLLDSKLGKALMLAVSVFSMGSALLAGGKGFMAGEGFIGKFINGGKEFLNSIIGTKFDTVGGDAAAGAATGEVAGAAGELAAEQSVSAGDMLTGGDVTGAAGVGEAAAVGAGEAAGGALVQGANAMNAAPPVAAPATVAKESGGWLSKAANAAMDFAKTDAGSTIIGNVIAGAGAGAREKNRQEFDSRVERMFDDPNNAGVQALQNHDYNVDAPRGMAAASNRLAQKENAASGRYTPKIPYRRPVPTPTG